MGKATTWMVAGLMMLAGAGVLCAEEAVAAKGSKDEAKAMVKKAIEFIKANGNEKAFEEFNNTKGKFTDRDLYVVVYDMTGKCLSHGANIKKVGKDLIDDKDVDGKPFMKERVEMMKKETSGWQSYKFRNPVSNEIEPKAMYLERHGDLIVGCGAYQQ